ncbi:MAG: hypothetical protein WC832_02110 [Anaerolineales bacterium]
MNTKTFYAFISILLVVLVTAVSVIPAAADDIWTPIVSSDGSVDTSSLVDLGLQDVPADWMPSVAGIGGVAEYHAYQDPVSGTVYMMPTPLTYFFMAASPEESGLSGSIGALSGNAENSAGYATDSAFIAGILSGNMDISDYTSFLAAGYTNWGDLFDAVLSGETDIWSLPSLDMVNFLTSLLRTGLAEDNLYAVILAFPQGACVSLPGDCPPGMVDNTPPVPVVVDPPACAAPYTTTGPITVTGGPGAGDGGKLAPLHPVVVGQDPQRRGVVIQAQVLVPLITYHYFETVRHEELLCLSGPANSANHGCPGPAFKYSNGASWTPSAIYSHNNFEQVHVYFECIEHTRTYTDYISAVTINLSLTEESRQWILTSLEQAYPGAHLKHPSFSFSYPGPGSLAGSGVTWTHVASGIPVEDPGWWAVTVNVLTTGTPVSGARFVTVPIGQFLDELVRVTLTSGDQP